MAERQEDLAGELAVPGREGRRRSSAGAIACATSCPTSRTPLLSGSSQSRSGGSSSAARMRAFDGATGRAAVERSSAAM